MPDEIQQTQTKPPAENWFVDGLKKQSVTVAFAAVFAFYTFFWNSHDSAKDQKYQIDTNTKSIEHLAQAQKEQVDSMNQFLIAITKVGEAQNRLASDVRDMQQQQQRNTEQLLNRK